LARDAHFPTRPRPSDVSAQTPPGEAYRADARLRRDKPAAESVQLAVIRHHDQAEQARDSSDSSASIDVSLRMSSVSRMEQRLTELGERIDARVERWRNWSCWRGWRRRREERR
jgi:hypothetical protein